MRRSCFGKCLIVGMIVTTGVIGSVGESSSAPRSNPLGEKDFFPIGLWLQNPAKAPRYREAGFNLYVGLWQGPTDEQLTLLKKAGMPVICSQNERALAHLDNPIIVGWMHQDEPDNAQSLGKGKGYGPPVIPEEVVHRYERMRSVDPSRPVLLNLGQGVAWDNWHGRGVRTRHPEDYPLYLKGCDIASFDIYPVTHRSEEVSGNLYYVARGVQRLVNWTGGKKPVWNCIECTRINHPTNQPTPHQVRCEVWMAIIHGSTGLIYFVHEWQPTFNESALLSDSAMLAAVTRINQRIQTLAPVLNSPSVSNGVAVVSRNDEVPIATMMKRHEGKTYVFAVTMREGRTQAEFVAQGIAGPQSVKVLDEDRTLESKDGRFTDSFEPWDVHLYQIDESK